MAELLLELRFPSGTATESVDVRVQVGPETTVIALADALASYVGRQRWADGFALAVERSGITIVLDPASKVLDAGLVNGDAVVLEAHGVGARASAEAARR
jgi:hypothetical protein